MKHRTLLPALLVTAYAAPYPQPTNTVAVTQPPVAKSTLTIPQDVLDNLQEYNKCGGPVRVLNQQKTLSKVTASSSTALPTSHSHMFAGPTTVPSETVSSAAVLSSVPPDPRADVEKRSYHEPDGPVRLDTEPNLKPRPVFTPAQETPVFMTPEWLINHIPKKSDYETKPEAYDVKHVDGDWTSVTPKRPSRTKSNNTSPERRSNEQQPKLMPASTPITAEEAAEIIDLPAFLDGMMNMPPSKHEDVKPDSIEDTFDPSLHMFTEQKQPQERRSLDSNGNDMDLSHHPWKMNILDTETFWYKYRAKGDPNEYVAISQIGCFLFPNGTGCPSPVAQQKLLQAQRTAAETAQRDVHLQAEKSWASNDYKRSIAHTDIVMPGMLTDEQVEDMRKELAYLNICLDDEDKKKAEQCGEKIENIWKRLRIEQKLREDKFPFFGQSLGGKYAEKGLEGAKMPRSPKQPTIIPLVSNTTSVRHNDTDLDFVGPLVKKLKICAEVAAGVNKNEDDVRDCKEAMNRAHAHFIYIDNKYNATSTSHPSSRPAWPLILPRTTALHANKAPKTGWEFEQNSVVNTDWWRDRGKLNYWQLTELRQELDRNGECQAPVWDDTQLALSRHKLAQHEACQQHRMRLLSTFHQQPLDIQSAIGQKRDLSPGDKDKLDGLWADSEEEYQKWATGFDGFE